MRIRIRLMNRIHQVLTIGILLALLLVGLGLYSDFGVSWDEPVQREYGRKVYEYVVDGNEELLADRHRVYGPVFEVLLYSVERGLGIEDSRDVYLTRHLVTFAMFGVGVAFFYLLGARILRSWKMGLLGAVFLVVSPRIFAHAFYNSKDIPFMAMFIVCMYTLLLYLDRKSSRAALLHGACCAVLVDIRIMGVFVPAVTLIALAYRMAAGGEAGSGRSHVALNLAIFCGAFVPLTILLWPTLWSAPAGNFIFAFQAMRKFAWRATVLFMGERVWSTDLPPYYTAVWILITLPVMYLVMSLAGFIAAIQGLVGRGANPALKRRDAALILLWLIAPLAFLVVSNAVLYDTWRHVFFVYPAILLLALIGLRWLVQVIGSASGGIKSKVGVAAAILLLAVNMGGAIRFMIRSHPHQNVYFNSIVGGTRGAAGKYEMDYWGLSYRKLLESVLEKDGRSRVMVYAHNEPGFYNSFLLPAGARERLHYAEKPGDADLYITNFRWERQDLPASAEFTSVAVDGVKLSASYLVSGPN